MRSIEASAPDDEHRADPPRPPAGSSQGPGAACHRTSRRPGAGRACHLHRQGRRQPYWADLVGSRDDDERLLIANLWRATADLLLTAHDHWTGSGKWLHRELVAFDRETGTEYSRTRAHGVRSIACSALEPMVDIVTQALNLFGGRLFDGFRGRWTQLTDCGR